MTGEGAKSVESLTAKLRVIVGGAWMAEWQWE